MVQLCCAESFPVHRRLGRYFLALCWIAGLICGMGLVLYKQRLVISVMRGILFAPVSIVGLLGICVLPFLITACAVFLSASKLLLAACFIKACLFSFVALGISLAYDSAGGMLRILLLFGDSVCTVLLYALWSRILSGYHVSWFVILVCLCAVWGACRIDYCVIAPFLAGLIEI